VYVDTAPIITRRYEHPSPAAWPYLGEAMPYSPECVE
jgi:hypothetical protein